jgi:hypothetical protein
MSSRTFCWSSTTSWSSHRYRLMSSFRRKPRRTLSLRHSGWPASGDAHRNSDLPMLNRNPDIYGFRALNSCQAHAGHGVDHLVVGSRRRGRSEPKCKRLTGITPGDTAPSIALPLTPSSPLAGPERRSLGHHPRSLPRFARPMVGIGPPCAPVHRHCVPSQPVL